jgi:hypothetical protein
VRRAFCDQEFQKKEKNSAPRSVNPATRRKVLDIKHAIQLRLGCSDLISSPRTGVQAILTKLCVAKSNRLYAVSSYTRQIRRSRTRKLQLSANDRSYGSHTQRPVMRCWLVGSTTICDAQAAPPRICDAQAAPPRECRGERRDEISVQSACNAADTKLLSTARPFKSLLPV